MPRDSDWCHLCIDMQRMFAEDTPWHLPWLNSVVPIIAELASEYAQHTVFTRFVPPARAEMMPGSWQVYYRRWEMMTGEHLPSELLNLVSPLDRYVPPAMLFDKRTYSPWPDGRLHAYLQQHNVQRLVVTGGESDVCVLATVLGAIDLGYHVLVLKDALCSGQDETYDASLKLFGGRFSSQVELWQTADFLDAVRHMQMEGYSG